MTTSRPPRIPRSPEAVWRPLEPTNTKADQAKRAPAQLLLPQQPFIQPQPAPCIRAAPLLFGSTCGGQRILGGGSLAGLAVDLAYNDLEGSPTKHLPPGTGRVQGVNTEARGRFSVVIPTLQRARELRPLVEQCAAHPLVREVLVINNAREPLPWVPPKVRVLQQAENIFVNPAWNLGAREARSDYLAIINDDIQFDNGLLDYTAHILAHPWVGLVVPATTNRRPAPHERPRARLAYERKWGQGIFMAMRREHYVPVPSDLLVFSGDDWLFYQQRHRRNVEIYGVWVATEMSSTVDSEKKFSELGLGHV